MLQKSYSKFSVTQQCILRVLGSVKKYANFSVAAVPKSSLLGPGLIGIICRNIGQLNKAKQLC